MFALIQSTFGVCDISDPSLKGATRPLQPGRYELEKIPNPYGHAQPWILVRGTKLGMAEKAWYGQAKRFPFQVSVIEDENDPLFSTLDLFGISPSTCGKMVAQLLDNGSCVIHIPADRVAEFTTAVSGMTSNGADYSTTPLAMVRVKRTPKKKALVSVPAAPSDNHSRPFSLRGFLGKP